jgi:hypothetical protein
MELKKKSRMTSLVLTLLLGPLGLFYSTLWGGIIMTFLLIATWPTVLGPVVICILSIGMGDYCTCRHNKRVDASSQTTDHEKIV